MNTLLSKTRTRIFLALAGLGFAALAFVVPAQAAGGPLIDGGGSSGCACTAPTGGTLTAQEESDLLFMREEEKLARDVYLTLYDTWGLPLFQNIAGSEQSHMNSVLALLDNYGLADPVGINPQGVFVNPELQALYDQLVAQGSQSLDAALRVGALIEEIDIADLDTALTTTVQADVNQVFQQLRAGSTNHLRAFVSTLAQQSGATYRSGYPRSRCLIDPSIRNCHFSIACLLLCVSSSIVSFGIFLQLFPQILGKIVVHVVVPVVHPLLRFLFGLPLGPVLGLEFLEFVVLLHGFQERFRLLLVLFVARRCGTVVLGFFGFFAHGK